MENLSKGPFNMIMDMLNIKEIAVCSTINNSLKGKITKETYPLLYPEIENYDNATDMIMREHICNRCNKITTKLESVCFAENLFLKFCRSCCDEKIQVHDSFRKCDLCGTLKHVWFLYKARYNFYRDEYSMYVCTDSDCSSSPYFDQDRYKCEVLRSEIGNQEYMIFGDDTSGHSSSDYRDYHIAEYKEDGDVPVDFFDVKKSEQFAETKILSTIESTTMFLLEMTGNVTNDFIDNDFEYFMAFVNKVKEKPIKQSVRTAVKLRKRIIEVKSKLAELMNS